MHFVAVVLKIKSNLIQISTRISVDIRTVKERSNGSNPPHSGNVSTNIVKSFLTILDRHFLKLNKLYETFNRNNVKISYSSMPNFACIIFSHNEKIINSNSQNLLHLLVIVVQRNLALEMVTVCNPASFTSVRQTRQI